MRTLVLAAAATAATLAFLHPVTPLAAAGPSVALVAPDGLTLPAPKAGRARPLVVVLADNAGVETTDFAIPYGVLKGSGVAEVRSVATSAGPIQLMPSLKILADQTVAQFDKAEPAGADIIIVPAQMKPKSPELAAWLRAQAGKGAVVVSICEGARVLANAGLLHDRRATTHWSALKKLAKAYPDTTWVRDRRYVQDGPHHLHHRGVGLPAGLPGPGGGHRRPRDRPGDSRPSRRPGLERDAPHRRLPGHRRRLSPWASEPGRLLGARNRRGAHRPTGPMR
jgi:putative intracellular protease/amidase